MTDKHTPVPWNVTPFVCPDKEDDPLGVYDVQPARQTLSLRLIASDPETEKEKSVYVENRANAKFIEVCVNYHDILVLALENVREFIMRFDEADDEEIAASKKISTLLEQIENELSVGED
jgi:hypothetical protein